MSVMRQWEVGKADIALAAERLLIAALSGAETPWDPALDAPDARSGLIELMQYHGIGGLLLSRSPLAGWPKQLVQTLRERARGVAIWELSHRRQLVNLFEALAAEHIFSLLLKGSALAYSLYPVAAMRERGDTDILVGRADLARVRAVLKRLGFAPDEGGLAEKGSALQESWSKTAEDGTSHSIDLHVEPFNMASGLSVASSDDAAFRHQHLPALGGNAAAPRGAFLLYHALLHPLMHVQAPYFSAGRAYYGGDRLVWLVDVDLLARSFDPAEWKDFLSLAVEHGQARPCLAGLRRAEGVFASPIPEWVVDRLHQASSHRPSYFERGRAGRAWADLRAAGGAVQMARYLLFRTFPDVAFMRSKYPGMGHAPLALLYARRIAEFAFPRRTSQ